MHRNPVGGTGLQLTDIAFGGAAIGNLYTAVDDATAHSAIETAWDLGIRYFDTAPHYGLGLSERRLGAALRDLPRDEFVLSTKAGRLLVAGDPNATAQDDDGFVVPATYKRVVDFSRDGIRRSVEESLERLGLDRIDVLYLHDPDNHFAQAIDEGFPALAELRAEGVVSAIGAGMNQWQMLAAFVRETDMDVLMLAGRYTLLDQSAATELLPLCVERGVSVVNVGVFNSGLLSAPMPRRGMHYNYADAPDEIVAHAVRLATVCQRHGVALPAAAFQFGKAHPAIVSTAMGAGIPDYVRANVELYETPIPADLWAELRSEGLVREDVPVPV